MTNVSFVEDLGTSLHLSLCLSPTTVWRASEAPPRWPYAFRGSYLSACQDVAGVRFSAPTEERSRALQEGLITADTLQKRRRDGRAGILSAVFKNRG